MWQRYWRTFKFTQSIILTMSVVIFFAYGNALSALIFFALMQGFALIGAVWAARLKRLTERSVSRLPLESRC